MKSAVALFATISAVGLILSLISHLAALLGMTGPLGNRVWILHIGIFIVWFPAVLVAQRLTRGTSQKGLWKAALRGCPEWMRNMTYGFFGYAMLNFAIFMFTSPKGKPSDGFMLPSEVRGFSGHWMAFYSAALAIHYSARRLWDTDWNPRCRNGHAISPFAKFCETCGEPVESALPFAK